MVRNVRDVKKTETKTKQTFFHSFFYYYSQTLDNLEFIVVKVISGKRDILPRFWTFTTVYMTSALAHASNCLALTGLALLGELRAYIKKAGQARRVILPSKKGDRARRGPSSSRANFLFLQEPITGFLMWTVRKVLEGNVWRVGSRPGKLGWVGDPSSRDEFSPCKRDLSSFYRFKWCGMTAPNLQFQGSKTRIERARHKLGT